MVHSNRPLHPSDFYMYHAMFFSMSISCSHLCVNLHKNRHNAQIILKTGVGAQSGKRNDGAQSGKRNDGTQWKWNATSSEPNPVFL